jgi:CRP-like cAMP-binding protein
MPPSAVELRTIPLFHGLTDEELGELAGKFLPVTIDANKPLFESGDPATALYLLTTGQATLERADPAPGDRKPAVTERFELRPPALIGELGALTGLMRSTRGTIAEGSTVWSLTSQALQEFFNPRQESGLRFIVNLLTVVADKVHRDQSRMADMRANLVRTQKELKRLRELVLEAPETELSAPVHDSLDKLITHNRRVNYRVEPPASLAAFVRLDQGRASVVDISRTHVALKDAPKVAVDAWLTGVLELAGTEIAISGRVQRAVGDRVTIELDGMIDEFSAALEGYLTRAQLTDVLV